MSVLPLAESIVTEVTKHSAAWLLAEGMLLEVLKNSSTLPT